MTERGKEEKNNLERNPHLPYRNPGRAVLRIAVKHACRLGLTLKTKYIFETTITLAVDWTPYENLENEVGK